MMDKDCFKGRLKTLVSNEFKRMETVMTNKKKRSAEEIRESMEKINHLKPSKEELVELANIINENATPDTVDTIKSLLAVIKQHEDQIKEYKVLLNSVGNFAQEGFEVRESAIAELEKNNHVMKMRIADLMFALEESRKGNGEI